MDSFTSMKSKLLPLGLYTIEDGSNLYAELKAYAAGLDSVFENLDTMLREYFIDTAQTYGITEREKLIGAQRDEYTLEKRREMLKNTEQTVGLACTCSAFVKILESYGLSDFTMTENFSEQTVSITVADSLSDEEKAWIEERAEADFPSHLKVEFTYV